MRCVTEDFVASDNSYGTRIARGDYLIGTRIASGGCHEGSSSDSDRSFDEASRSSQNALQSAARRVPNEAYIACRVSRKQQLHDHSIWNDLLPDLRSQQSSGHSFSGNDP